MTSAEAIAALEAAYPEYMFGVEEIKTTFHNRIPGTLNFDVASTFHYRIRIADRDNYTVSLMAAQGSVDLAVIAVYEKLPLTATTEAIAKVAAGLTDEALLKRP